MKFVFPITAILGSSPCLRASVVGFALPIPAMSRDVGDYPICPPPPGPFSLFVANKRTSAKPNPAEGRNKARSKYQLLSTKYRLFQLLIVKELSCCPPWSGSDLPNYQITHLPNQPKFYFLVNTLALPTPSPYIPGHPTLA